ncbi:biotin-dependent carboxyltransferase family protein [Castellaniella sp.]|uniref:5-oxoprolinase subunit C family protein n=1 Tax=Castellaniella sp. TaxID=1955812 RepID=UPI00355E3345
MIAVLKPGALSLLQDLGRYGWQRFGVVVSGAMDQWAHRCANALVGNADDAASLEMTLVGPSLLFRQAQVIALCGAHLSARIGAQEVPLNRALVVRAGARLDFGPRVSGVRAYLAVRGGFAVEPVLGSRSTHVRAGMGGLQGRALKKGDILPTVGGLDDAEQALLGTQDFVRLHRPARVAPVPRSDGRIRIVPGPQWDLFTEAAHRCLLDSGFRVAAQSDRMGIRLSGVALEQHQALEMISQGVTFGAVQVPADGQPIILMADRQTTGGYPKIAHVASVDLPRLAQCAPGERLYFETISLDTAQALYLEREQALAQWRASL